MAALSHMSAFNPFTKRMDCSDFPAGGAPKRSELLGPRPALLKIRKDSHKTKKPPAPAAPQHGAAPLPPPQQIRRPIIIYAVSPKVIHTTPGDFMSVVQRLTGAATASASSSSASADAEKTPFSPAARLASFERSTPKAAENFYRPSAPAREQSLTYDVVMGFDGGALTSPALFPGILSPMPSSLPCISPNLFAPPAAEQSQMSLLLNEVMISPAMQGSGGFMGMDSFLASPSSFFLSSGVVPSPAANYWDLFNQYSG